MGIIVNMKNQIEEILIKISQEIIGGANEWYNWRKINEEKIPLGIKLPEGNQYLKNIVLKELLHENWSKNNDLNLRKELIEYYIKTWGGIKGNKKESMEEYCILNSEELINKGLKGVASWSKALVLHDWNKYAIFDARVSCSLNAIQIIYETDNKTLFPVLASQNKRIIVANKNLKRIAKKEKWNKEKDDSFYNNYLELLSKVASKLGTNISTIEMLLFAKAEEFINKVNLLEETIPNNA